MKELNPIEKVEYIKKEFKKYISSTYYLENDAWNNKFQEELKKTELLKGPYISRNLEFQTTKTLNELIKEGIIHKDFAKLGDIQLDRKLYSHQEKAIRLINQKHNLIITTGTASGKTESFLYPIINEILHEKNINVPGIRAIFLFPINALVNDQFDRVRKILCKYPNIKYAYFTGDTEEKIKDLNSERQKIRNATGIDISTNELMDRESIRNNPPHILFTNYSMLEYMLLRPIDSTLFTKENIGKLKFIVLDEAHTYKGALGIEIGMLMRRLLQRIGKDDVQFILASATLGEKEGIEKIQEFGYNLTSKTYNKEDILFADKVQLNSNNAKYTVDPTDYEEIYNSNYDSNTLKQILNKYHINQNDDQQAALYDLVIQDPNLYKVNSILSKKSIIIKDLLEEMKKHGFTIESLSAFIDIICKCKKANLKIMDIKYHTFIRSASGAFITLDENSKISLNQREYIDDKKAFEIGNCNKCKSVYIIGIHKDNTIYQNNSIDIYENYNEQDKTIVDYFILEDEIDTDKDYGDKLTKYLLCPKCAKTIKADATDTSRICEDRDTKKVVVYKVNKEKSEVQNNLTECPICEQRNPYGMISTVGIGKDLATAIIAQIFFESISKEQKNDDKKYVKQILSFSDSRQQAAFSAKSCQNDHYKLLRKKLLFKILENRQEMSFDDAEAKLDAKIEEKKLFEEDETKQAKITLLKDILYIDKIPSGEEVGLYYFEYEPINKLISTLQDDDLIDLLHDLQINCKITLEEFKVYLKFIINELKNKVCIYYDGLAREDKDKYLSYKKFNKYVTYTKQNEYSGKIKDKVWALISTNKKLTKIEKYTTMFFNIDKTTADELIRHVYDTLKKEILKKYDSKQNLYQLDISKFHLHRYDDINWFFCNNCKKITRFNAKQICQNCLKINTLEQINVDKKLESDYYREQYKNKKIERLTYQEHTAQLSLDKAKKVQNEFKQKEINYLSCSTTFEMGIDLGALENVLLRNVPPTASNYIQRAGRAGRSEESSAFVLTYCSSNSHDYTFFLDPLKMIDGKCNTPIFRMENHKIIYRHLLAMALSQFFKNYPEAFGSVETFYSKWFDEFIKFLQSKPESLIQSTNNVLPNEKVKKDLKNGKWINNILKEDSDFNIKIAKKKFDKTWSDLEKQKEVSKVDEDGKSLDYYKKQSELLKNTDENNKNLITNLANNNLIPKYCFPTDLVQLYLNKYANIKDDDYRLVRDLKIALYEYAPSSEIMVDKKIITSRYICNANELSRLYSYECKKCHKVTVNEFRIDKMTCETCKEEIKERNAYFITPKFGFFGFVEDNKEGVLKPKQSFSSPLRYIGQGLEYNHKKINDLLEFSVIKDDELLIKNDNNFFVCEDCGYTIVNNEYRCNNLDKVVDKLPHKDSFNKQCNNKELKKHSLGFKYKTDVLKMKISLPFEHGEDEAHSVLYALLEGIALAFDIERNDIDGIYIYENYNPVFVLFDTVPGGAGHVTRLLEEKEMKKAFEYAYEKVNQNCCDTSCYSCIRNYKNQKYHTNLRRELAKNYLEKIIKTFDNNNITKN